MYIEGRFWNNPIGDTDYSLNLVAFLEDRGKEEIALAEIFSAIGLDRQGWDFHRTVEYMEDTPSNGVETDLHFAST